VRDPSDLCCRGKRLVCAIPKRILAVREVKASMGVRLSHQIEAFQDSSGVRLAPDLASFSIKGLQGLLLCTLQRANSSQNDSNQRGLACEHTYGAASEASKAGKNREARESNAQNHPGSSPSNSGPATEQSIVSSKAGAAASKASHPTNSEALYRRTAKTDRSVSSSSSPSASASANANTGASGAAAAGITDTSYTTTATANTSDRRMVA
jgi:hypothetical protein